MASVLLGFDNVTDRSDSWVDAHALPRIDGVWKIMNKTATAGGTINVTMPPHYVKCAYQMVAVRAFDLTNHTVSNVVYARLGPGPC